MQGHQGPLVAPGTRNLCGDGREVGPLVLRKVVEHHKVGTNKQAAWWQVGL